MIVYFADSSALARTYLNDETGSADLRALLGGAGVVVASQLAHVEVANSLAVADRSGRLGGTSLDALLAEYASDVGPGRRIRLLPLDPEPVLTRAREIVIDHPIRSLDALHLAVAETTGRALAEPDELVFVTRDERQRAVAEALGLATA